jgi:hypothetical protein
LRAFLRTYLPRFGPTLAACVTFTIGYVVLLFGKYSLAAYCQLFFFFFLVPWPVFAALSLALSRWIGLPLEDAYRSVGLASIILQGGQVRTLQMRGRTQHRFR